MQTQQQIHDFLKQHFPAAIENCRIEAIHARGVTVRFAIGPEHLRPGQSVSGPTIMTLADVAVYMAILAHVGLQDTVLTNSLNVHFLARPAADQDLRAEVELIKIGRRLVIAETKIYSWDENEPVAHATVSYSRI